MEFRERLKRIQKCTILFVSIFIILGIIAAQFFRLKTPAGMIVTVIIAIIGVILLIFFVLHVYKDLCEIEKPKKEE